MTENEAIKEIETSLELAEMCKPNREREKEIKAYKMAIQALKKVQQFEAIGTIEDFKALKEKSVTKRIIQTVENGRMKRVFSCCGTDCTQMTSWMTPKFCPHCGSKTET